MARLRLSVAARRDLEEIEAYGLVHFGRDATIAHLEAFDRVFELLKAHPLAGQEQLQYGSDIRSFSVSPHRILYSATAQTVSIIRVLHSARHVPSALND